MNQGNRDLWLIETARGVLRRFTSDPAIDGDPVWAPDSNRIAFLSRRSGPKNLWLKRIDGGTEERLRESAENEAPTDWSPDGRFILFTERLREICGRCRLKETESQWQWPIPALLKAMAASHRTGAAWPTNPTKRDAMKSTSYRFPAPAFQRKFLPTAA